ncbi:MAG: TIGR02186 family protein [Hyphomonadaceae bacterium]|nr:TIGR02186 family protein [Hyphomonadaceae bacterium]
MKALLAALILLLLAQAPARAQQAGDVASDLPAAVAEERISVSSAYRGSVIDVWGVNPDRRGRGDVVVVVRGPDQPATVMRKRRVFGLWVNGDPVRFAQAPSFFAVLSNRPLRQIASPSSIWSLELDPAASAQLESAVPAGADPSEYRAALVRLRGAQGLYLDNDRTGVTMYAGGLFRARVQLPANAPIADYHADTYLFRDGRLISSQRIPIRIARVGIERRIHDLATNYSMIYGILCVMMALAGGWLAAFVFRRS